MHKTVLQKEAVEGLALRKDSVVIDCTLGAGGHAKCILDQLGKEGTYLGLDADPLAIDLASKALEKYEATVYLQNSNFKNLQQIVAGLKLSAPNAILADLGWRSDQFEKGNKGFSFSANEPLLMTYGDPKDYTFTAYDIVNDWDESSIADVIYGYGEEPKARKIARAIVAGREEKPIKTAQELTDIVSTVVKQRGRINPATKTFQALRITVNDELGALKTLLTDGFELLLPQGRMVIITFHSLEDRIVKQFNKSLAVEGKAKLINKRPIVASLEELKDNPRARSAKLRIIEKL